ncbi:hypothetical protein [Leclercia adecarboxylata]
MTCKLDYHGHKFIEKCDTRIYIFEDKKEQPLCKPHLYFILSK